jgi:tetratricopeptide (TPR) repeat protein
VSRPEGESDAAPADTPADGADALCLLVARVAEAVEGEFAAGRTPDPGELAARFPEGGDRVRDLVTTLALLHEVGSGEAGDPAGAAGPGYRLGEYRIVREVGRGGMGVVYEAVEPALRRRVALKVLPGAAVLDPRRLQRFRAEAQAAAGLAHPNIVPVYATGCAGGVHYFAMQFVEGESLAAGVARRRQAGGPPADPPVLRDAARLGAAVADALEYAHQCGVVHRDVKPANLLLDASGRVWVTDFGLARLPDEAGVTLSGDLVGTLRYMSPEQALAPHGLVDHRADVFALGATLYELLTLEPVRGGAGREELLRQVTGEEPRPVRRRNPRVPVDLETVVMKALRREPAERYATARELADDLRRWLDGRPVAARPPGAWERLQGWARRHRAAVTATAAALLVSTAVLATATVVALAQRDEARHQRAAADEQRDAFRREYARAEREARVAGEQRDKARQRLEQARRAAKVTSEAVLRLLRYRPQLGEEQLQLMREAVRIYRDLAVEDGAEPAVRFEAARALLTVGSAWVFLGDRAAAAEHFREAIGRLEPLVAEFPHERSYRVEMATAWTRFSQALPVTESAREATEANRLWDEVAGTGPMDFDLRRKFAHSLQNLGYIYYSQDRFADAQRVLSRSRSEYEWLVAQAPDDRDAGADLAGNHLHHAELSMRLGQPAAALDSVRAGMRVLEPYVRRHPNSPNVRHMEARLLGSLAKVLRAVGRTREAEADAERSLASAREMVRDFPRDQEYRQLLSANLLLLVSASMDRGEHARAITLGREWVQVCQQWSRDHPSSRTAQETLAEAHGRLGYSLMRTNQVDEALTQNEAAVRIQEALARGSKDGARRFSLVVARANYATCLAYARRWDEAEALADSVIEHCRSVAGQPDARYYTAFTLQVSALIRLNRGHFFRVLDRVERSHELFEQLCKEEPHSAEYRRRAQEAANIRRRALEGIVRSLVPATWHW